MSYEIIEHAAVDEDISCEEDLGRHGSSNLN